MIFVAFFKVEKRLVHMKGRNVLTRWTLVHSKMENESTRRTLARMKGRNVPAKLILVHTKMENVTASLTFGFRTTAEL
jgi:hypothetical protein